jgi:hypothetical protein
MGVQEADDAMLVAWSKISDHQDRIKSQNLTQYPFFFRVLIFQDILRERLPDMKDHWRDDRDALLNHSSIALDPLGRDTEEFLNEHD